MQATEQLEMELDQELNQQLQMNPGKPARRVFVSTWSETRVVVKDRLRFSQLQFFTTITDAGHESVRALFTPDQVSYREMLPFIGKKTRITIEVIE